MNDNNMPSLHSKANELLVWNLSNRVRNLRGGIGQVSTAIEALAGGALVPVDAPGQADAGSDIDGCESQVLSMSMFASKADYDKAMLQTSGGVKA